MSNPTDTPPTDDPLVQLRKLNEQRRRQERAAVKARYRRRIVAAGGIDPESLSLQGRRILNWLAEWDDWTVEGLEEILTATRAASRNLSGPSRPGRQEGLGL